MHKTDRKYRSWIVCLLGLAFWLGACKDPYGDPSVHSQRSAHSYGDSVEEGRKPERNYEEIRDIWQRPDLILERMGNLKGKSVADIGAGPVGYFSLRILGQKEVKKVIAVDIDQEALGFIDNAAKKLLPESKLEKLETRLVPPDDPSLQPSEVDAVLIVNTCTYFTDRKDYFTKLHRALTSGGRLLIVDFKNKNLPGMQTGRTIPLGVIESELMETGYEIVESDDLSLEFQYIVTAQKP